MIVNSQPIKRARMWLSALLLMALTPAFGGGAQHSLNVAGRSINYQDVGTGTPVLFVHGAVADARAWAGYEQYLGEGQRFISYTQRYFGSDPWGDDGDDYSLETHSKELIGFVEALLPKQKVHVVAWSYSGAVVIEAVSQRPDLFHSIVHYEPFHRGLDPLIPEIGAAMKDLRQHFGPVGKALKSGDAKSAGVKFVEAAFKIPTDNRENITGQTLQMWRDNGRTIPLQLRLQYPSLSAQRLRQIDIPTLVVVGAQTWRAYALYAEAVASHQPKARLVTLDQATHGGPLHQAAAFGALIKGFVSEVDASR